MFEIQVLPQVLQQKPVHSDNRHGDAASEWTGEGALGMSPCKKQICKRHTASVRPDGIDRHSMIFNIFLHSQIAFHTLSCVIFFCLYPLKLTFKTCTDTVVIYPALSVVNSIVRWVE